MKPRSIGAIAVLLAIVCVGQQVWICRQDSAAAAQAVAPSVPPATYDVELLSRSLQMPKGATIGGDRETGQLQGTGHGTTGFEAQLWINTSGIEFSGRSKDLREERAAEVTAFYAKQIAAIIPSALIECAMDRPGMAERGSLHSTFLIRHPSGCIVVSGGYMSATGLEPGIGEIMKVQVLSSNSYGNARRELIVDGTLPTSNQ